MVKILGIDVDIDAFPYLTPFDNGVPLDQN